MKRMIVLAGLLLVSRCTQTDQTVDENQNCDDLGTNRIVTHIVTVTQSVTTTIIQDSSLNCDYPGLQVDPCLRPDCGCIVADRMQTFASTLIDSTGMLLLARSGYNYRPVGTYYGAGLFQQYVSVVPYDITTPSYVDSDSMTIHVDSVNVSLDVFVRAGQRVEIVAPGGQCVFTDSLLARTDSLHCWQRLVVTRTVTNHGLDLFPDWKYGQYFM